MAERRGSAQLSLGFAHPDGSIPAHGDRSDSRRAAGKDFAICRHCRRPLEVSEWILDAGVRLHYCDDRCRRAWVEAEPDFGVRTEWNGGSRRGANWNLQACKARQRDQFTCGACGVTEEEIGQRLHVHHRIPYRRFRSNVEANKLEHLISVCPACHQKQEAELRRQLPLFSIST